MSAARKLRTDHALPEQKRTFFIRHKSDSAELLKRLTDDKRIAIFYDGQPFDKVFIKGKGTSEYFESQRLKKATDYNNAYATSLKYFDDLSTDGGYVFAEYGNGSSGCLLGVVKPGTEIEPIDSLSHVTLRMSDVEQIHYSDFPVLLAIRPPYGTICIPQRETYSLLARQRFEGAMIQPRLDLLHPKMAEQMCLEYLRIVGIETSLGNSKLTYCLILPGKTVATIDIAGRLENGAVVYAQVKNGEIPNSSADTFIDFLKSDNKKIGVIFHSVKSKRQGLPQNIVEINVDDVFRYFSKKIPKMISDMIGINSLR